MRLGEGTFYTAQLLVSGLNGRIEGAGQQKTILHSPDYPLPIDRNCMGASGCFAFTPPSATNRYPSMVTVLDGHVTLADFSIVAAGGHGTDVWDLWGFPVEVMSNVLEFMGSNTSYRVERVAIDGGTAPFMDPVSGHFIGDSAGGLIFWSFWQPWLVTDSSLAVTDSTFKGQAGLTAYNLDRSRVVLRRSTFNVIYSALAISDIRNSQVLAEGNDIKSEQMGAIFWPGPTATGIADSSLWFGKNVMSAPVGFMGEPGTFANVKCEAVNNDLGGATVPYALNGNACKVVAVR